MGPLSPYIRRLGFIYSGDASIRDRAAGAALASWTSGGACSGCPEPARRSSAVRILEWHPTLDRFGAAELKESLGPPHFQLR